MMTGDEYRESLRDGRRVFSHGRRLDDVAGDMFTKLAVDMVASGYDEHYDPSPGAHGPYFFIPTSGEELREAEERRRSWDVPTQATISGLLMLLTASGLMRASHPEYSERTANYFEESKVRDVRCALCITDVKGDRSKRPAEQDDPDLYLRIVDRRRDGIVISGAKIHISSAPIAHELIVMPTKRMREAESEWAVACAVPANAEGVTILATTFAPRPDFDERSYPYSRHNVMTEGLVIFDEVFVPNERVFLCGEVEHSATFAHSLGLWERLSNLGQHVEIADVLVGLAQLINEANGTTRISHVRDKIAEMTVYAALLRSTYDSAIANATSTPDGYAAPDEMFTNAGKYYAAKNFSVMVHHLQDIAGGAILTTPTAADIDNPDTGALVEKYMRTMPGVDADYRMRLFHTIRDLTADRYGGWQHVSVIQGGGGIQALRSMTRMHYDMDRAKHLALWAAGMESHPG